MPWNEASLDSIRKRLAERPSAGSEPPSSANKTGGSVSAGPDRSTRNPSSDEDLFHEAMADVRERPEFRRLDYRSGRAGHPAPAVAGNDLDSIFVPAMEPPTEVRFQHTDEYMEGCGDGIRPDICRDLHAGRIPAQDHLDMHGMSLEEGKLALARFIRDARARGLKCVNVIHGRGLRSPEGPVLKEGLRTWLETGSLRKWVMAYATAPRKQGGPGATYLLLR